MDIFSASFKPLNVSLLILPECSMMSVACTIDPMRAANRVARETVFNWQILTLDGGPVELTCGLPVMADAVFDDAPFDDTKPPDVLIIIAGYNNETHATKPFITKLAKTARRYAAVGGVEAGSWVLARAGLLHRQRATTHWEDLEEFANRFSTVEVLPDRFVVDGRYFTTGGASPAFDLMLHLISRRRGAPFAMEVAGVFIYDDPRSATEAQHVVSLGEFHNVSAVLSPAVRLMEEHLDTPISIYELAVKSGISVRTLETRFQSAFGTSPGKFYRNLRLQMARRLLVETSLPVQEISLRTGFSSPSAFSRAIAKKFGKRPGKLRR